jgi:hypothetical protein
MGPKGVPNTKSYWLTDWPTVNRKVTSTSTSIVIISQPLNFNAYRHSENEIFFYSFLLTSFLNAYHGEMVFVPYLSYTSSFGSFITTRSLKLLSLLMSSHVKKNCHCSRPRSPIGLWDVEDPALSRQLLTDGTEVDSLMRRQRFTAKKIILVLISVRGWVTPRAMVRLEELGQLKKIQWPRRDSNPLHSSLLQSAARIFTFSIEWLWGLFSPLNKLYGGRFIRDKAAEAWSSPQTPT